MRHASLFSGIGGFDLAAQWMGWENIFQVEIDPFCQKVLEKNFPQTKRYADIKEFDGTKYRGAIDIISGGFPCQPFSVAGKRKGKEDNRYLWPEMLRVISEIRPSFIVGENVTGIIGMALEQVLASLEAEGYYTETFIIPACAVNAPHRRDRIWIVAYADSIQSERWGRYKQLESQERKSESNRSERERIRNAASNCGKTIADPDKQRLEIWQLESNAEELKTAIRTHDRWKNWPTQSGLCGGNDGVPNRVDRIKGLGNAIVPQVAFEIFKAIKTIK